MDIHAQPIVSHGPDYGLTARFVGMSVAEAKRQISEALAREGFGVLSEIDVQATLEAKLNQQFRPYVILGACSPALARDALTADLAVGLLLPCNVCIWQEQGDAVVSIVRPDALMALTRNPALAPIAELATERLRVALAHMHQTH